jgi:hypothetical protein
VAGRIAGYFLQYSDELSELDDVRRGLDSDSASDGLALGGLYCLRWARASVSPTVIIASPGRNANAGTVIIASPGRNANAGTTTIADAATTIASSVVQCVVHESELWSDPAHGMRNEISASERRSRKWDLGGEQVILCHTGRVLRS